METCSVVLTFESVDEILWCDHSNETSPSAMYGVICFPINIMKWNLEFFFNLIFGTLESYRSSQAIQISPER